MGLFQQGWRPERLLTIAGGVVPMTDDPPSDRFLAGVGLQLVEQLLVQAEALAGFGHEAVGLRWCQVQRIEAGAKITFQR